MRKWRTWQSSSRESKIGGRRPRQRSTVAAVAAPRFQTSVESAFHMKVEMSLSALESPFDAALGRAIKSGNPALISLEEMVDEPNKMLPVRTCMLCIILSINKAGMTMNRGKNNGSQVGVGKEQKYI
jgi:hypothetical protein